jgi:hypothetical protein
MTVLVDVCWAAPAWQMVAQAHGTRSDLIGQCYLARPRHDLDEKGGQHQPCIVNHMLMFAPARRRGLRCLATVSNNAPESISTFLLPACRSFATTSPCQSKIGSAPLSIPPGVTFKIIRPPARARAARVQAMSTVQIKGPLGELSMAIPAYVNINEDPALPGPTLTVQDSRDAKQRAMWGAPCLV